MENGRVKLTSALPAGSRTEDKILIGLNANMESYWIPNLSNVEKIYHCDVLPGKCLYSTTSMSTYQRHKQTCSDECIVYSKRRTYGGDEESLNLAIKSKLLPQSFENYRQKFVSTYDIETLEYPDECVAQGQQAVLKIASIAMSSNLPDVSSECWIRKSSKPEHGKEIIDQFLDKLFALEQIYYDNLPDEIKAAHAILEEMEEEKFSLNKTKMSRLRNLVKKYHAFAVYSFNGGEFVYCITHHVHL